MGESLVFGRRRAENEYVGIMDRRSPRVEKHLHSAMKQEEQKKTERKEYFVAQSMLEQGPLITDGQNSCKWTGPTVGLSKSFIKVKISGQILLK